MGWTKAISGTGLAVLTAYALVNWQGYVDRVAGTCQWDPYMGAASRGDAAEVLRVDGIQLLTCDEDGQGQVTVFPKIRLSQVLEHGGVDLTQDGVLTVQAQDGLGWCERMFSMEGLRRGEVNDVLLRRGDKVQLELRDMDTYGNYGVGGDGVMRPGMYPVMDGARVGDVLEDAGCVLERLRGRWVVVRRPAERGGNVNVEVEALLDGEEVAVKAGDFVEVLPVGKTPAR